MNRTDTAVAQSLAADETDSDCKSNFTLKASGELSHDCSISILDYRLNLVWHCHIAANLYS